MESLFGQGDLQADRLARHRLGEARPLVVCRLAGLDAGRGDDLVSTLLDAEESGDALSSDELTALLETILVAGADTTKLSLVLGLYLFAKNPEQWRLLAEEPELVRSAVEEVLRFRPEVPASGRFARRS
jgi:cytochrome P450